MIRRVNLFGGPGVGESTLAARFFAHLKQQKANIELVQEFVKQYVYEGRRIRSWNYVHTFASQFEAEHRLMQGGVQRIVTDSPLLLQCVYAKHHGCVVHQQLAQICKRFDEEFPSLNFFVRRNFHFQEVGRWENEGQAIEMDRIIEETLNRHDIIYTPVRPGHQCDVDYCYRLLKDTFENTRTNHACSGA